jgi:hypothetical protein
VSYPLRASLATFLAFFGIALSVVPPQPPVRRGDRRFICQDGPLEGQELVVCPGDRELWVWKPERQHCFHVENEFPSLAAPGFVFGCYDIVTDREGADFLLWRRYPQPGDVVAEVSIAEGRTLRAVALAARGD